MTTTSFGESFMMMVYVFTICLCIQSHFQFFLNKYKKIDIFSDFFKKLTPPPTNLNIIFFSHKTQKGLFLYK